MTKWILAAFSLWGLFNISGCIVEEVADPAIVFDYSSHITSIEKLKQKSLSLAQTGQGSESLMPDIPNEWIPPAYCEKKWTAIVLHHSATDKGDATFFNKAHEGRCDENGVRWKGIGYDFVIGNGTMSGDGQVEVTFRWREQIAGAHCRTDRSNWANRDGIGICLVGNFDKTTPSRHQMDSLVQLVQFLQQRYGISKSRIYGHGQTPGAGPTACPGRKFPIWWLKSQLEF
jgi:hypothetical protein